MTPSFNQAGSPGKYGICEMQILHLALHRSSTPLNRARTIVQNSLFDAFLLDFNILNKAGIRLRTRTLSLNSFAVRSRQRFFGVRYQTGDH